MLVKPRTVESNLSVASATQVDSPTANTYHRSHTMLDYQLLQMTPDRDNILYFMNCLAAHLHLSIATAARGGEVPLADLCSMLRRPGDKALESGCYEF